MDGNRTRLDEFYKTHGHNKDKWSYDNWLELVKLCGVMIEVAPAEFLTPELYLEAVKQDWKNLNLINHEHRTQEMEQLWEAGKKLQ